MFDKFRWYYSAKGGRFVDWVAAWRGWINGQVEIDAKAKTNYVDWRA